MTRRPEQRLASGEVAPVHGQRVGARRKRREVRIRCKGLHGGAVIGPDAEPIVELRLAKRITRICELQQRSAQVVADRLQLGTRLAKTASSARSGSWASPWTMALGVSTRVRTSD